MYDLGSLGLEAQPGPVRLDTQPFTECVEELTERRDFPRERYRCCKTITSSQVSMQALIYNEVISVVSIEQLLHSQKWATKQFKCHLQSQPSAKRKMSQIRQALWHPPIHQADESLPEDKKKFEHWAAEERSLPEKKEMQYVPGTFNFPGWTSKRDS